jgi:ribosomal protein L16 Arg81 hydroxylase
MAEAGKSILAELVAPHSANEFLTQYWPEKRFVAHGDVERLPSFLRAPELHNIELLSKNYRGRLLFTSGRKIQVMQRIDQVQPIALYRMGLTVQFQDLGSCIAPLGPELRRLEFELGVEPGGAHATAFASPVSEGLSVHFDAQDLFSIQLRGTKRFHVATVEELPYPRGSQFCPGTAGFDDLYPQARNGFPDPGRATFTSVEMKAGSVLFIPRGTWHHTESQGDSISVSIALDTPSAADCVLDQLRLLLLQYPQWRRPMYGAWGNDAAHDAATPRAAQLLAELPDIARQLSAADVTTNLMPLERRLAAIKPTSRFQKTPNSRVEVEPSPSTDTDAHEVLSIMVTDLNYGTQPAARIKASVQVAAVFRWLGEQTRPFSAGELSSHFPQLPFTEHQRILGAATVHGLVKMLWFPARAD